MSALSLFNLSWVDERLAIGGSFPIAAAAQLAGELGVRHVVDTRDEEQDDAESLRAHGMDFLHVPTQDHCGFGMCGLDVGVAWVLPRLERGERVLIHCEHGMGRSVLLGMCVLVRLGQAPIEAIRRIKDARPCASPSPMQLQTFVVWSRANAGEHPVPSWDELAKVVYRRRSATASAWGQRIRA